MDDTGTVLLVLLSGDPRGTEGAEGSKRGGALPDSVLTVLGGNDSDLSTSGSESLNLSLQAVSKTLVHGATTREDHVLGEVATHIDIRVLDGSPGEVLDGHAGLTVQIRLEEELSGLETDAALDGDHGLIGKGVGLILSRGSIGGGELSIVVSGDIAKLLLDVLDGLELGGRGEGVSGFEKELLAVVSDDAASDLHLLDGVRDGETLEDGDGVSDTITGVDDKTGGATIGVQRHDSLDSDVRVLHVESLEHVSHHLLSIFLRVARSLGDEDTLDFLRSDTELVVEGVMPDGLHLGPVGDDTVGDGVAEVENTSLLLGFVANILGLLGNTLHGAGLLWLTDNGGEYNGGSVVTSDTGLHHTGTVVNNSNSILVSVDHWFLLLV